MDTVDPQIEIGVAAIGRVAHALVDVGSLQDVTSSALIELRTVLQLEQASLYLPDPAGRPLLVRSTTVAGTESPRVCDEEISFEPEAWQLAMAGGAPLVFREEGGWLIDNPFQPFSDSWLVLPLLVDQRLLGAVIASAEQPLSMEPTAIMVLRLLGDLIAAGVNRAQVRQELARASLEQERGRLAALVHDGLAQDLALAAREIAWLDANPEPDVAEASWIRLRAAIGSANTLIRERLKSLSVTVPIGGIHEASVEVCDRYEQRGLTIRLERRGNDVYLTPARTAAVMRVMKESLMNVLKHAPDAGADVLVETTTDHVVIQVTDQGVGFVPEDAAAVSEGHLGLVLMRQRAAEAGGTVHWTPGTPAGMTVTLRVPIAG